MKARTHLRIWVTGILIAGVMLYLLRGVLLPFVAGMAVAFLFDPLADKLEKFGMSRVLATVIITLGFFLILLTGLVLLAPLIAAQIAALIENLPGYFDRARALLESLADGRLRHLMADNGATPDISRIAGSVIGWTSDFLGHALSGGLALFNIVALLFLTPVVSFYLLLDWDRLVARIDALLPLQNAATIRALAREIERTLSGFVRGQISVCFLLAAFYAIGLSLAGLNFGLVIGIAAGLLSFIPFFGAISGLLLSLLFAVFQFWPDYLPIAVVSLIFIAGQALEGNFLTPRLVGRRVGLHPLWVIFALLAFGALFGLLGMMLAVPLAAVSGVLVRHFTLRYLTSGLYRGVAVVETDDTSASA